jgi:hypothetical protein
MAEVVAAKIFCIGSTHPDVDIATQVNAPCIRGHASGFCKRTGTINVTPN